MKPQPLNYKYVIYGILILAAGAIFLVGLYESVVFALEHTAEIFGGLVVIAGFFGLWGIARFRTATNPVKPAKRRKRR